MGSCCGSPTQEEPLVPEVPAEFKAEMDRDIERCLFRSSMTEDEDDGALDALVRKRVSTWAWRQRLASCPILRACWASLSLHWPQTHPLTTQVDSIKETHKDELGSPKTSDQEGSKREVADITKARLQVHHEKLVIQGKARARSQSVVVRTARRASISMMEQNHIAKGGTKQEFDNQMGQLKRQRTQSLPKSVGHLPFAPLLDLPNRAPQLNIPGRAASFEHEQQPSRHFWIPNRAPQLNIPGRAAATRARAAEAKKLNCQIRERLQGRTRAAQRRRSHRRPCA